MKRIFKRTFAVILVAVMLLSVAPMGEIADWFAARAAAASYQYIQYGNYPQSRETNSSVISTLNAKAGSISTWNSYGYYSGTGSMDDGQMTAKDYMKYKDVVVGGVKYRGVYFSSYRPYFTGYRNSDGTYQDDNGYYTGTSYWFRYEPLTWRVLNSSTGLVLCENIIDSQAYNNYILYSSNEYYGNASKTYYANNYYYSSIRKWLNDDFYNTAFTDTQKKNIETTHPNNNCYSSSYPQYNAPASDDKVFLLSCDEARNSSYGFSSSAATYDTARRAQGTDYAKCQGLWFSKSSSYYGNSWWWLRSPFDFSNLACGVDYDGYSGHSRYVYYTYEGVRPALKLSHLKSDISQSGISNSNSGSAVSANINSIRITPREANASIKLNGANIASKDISFSLKSVTAEVGGKTFTQNSDKIIEIPTKDVTGDITIKKSGYDDYVIPREVYNSFTTASLDNILDYEAYMTQSRQDGKVYVSSVFGRVSGSGDDYVDLTRNSMKITPDTSYDFYITALNKGSSASYYITQDDAHKLNPQSTGKFTSSTIGSDLINGKSVYVYVNSGGKRSELVPIKLDVEQGEDNWFVKQLKAGTLALGGSDGISIKVPESWVLIGGSELNIRDFNFPVGVNVTGNKVKVSVGFDLWKNPTTESTSKCAVDPDTQEQIDKNHYITEKKSGVLVDGMWKTVKDGLKDAEWSWKNASTKAEKANVKKRLADRYGLSIGDLSSSSKKTSGFDVSALGYIEGELIGGKFIISDFMISVSGSFTISYTQQYAVGYIGIEGGGKVTVSFNAERGVADQFVDFNLKAGVNVTPSVTPYAGLGIKGVANIGLYGTASIPMGLIFSFNDKTLTASVQINGEIGYEAQLLIWKTGRHPLVSGTAGPWSHVWKFGKSKAFSTSSFMGSEIFESPKNQTASKDLSLKLTDRKKSSGWLSEPTFGTASISVESGISVSELRNNVYENANAKIVTCGDITLASWVEEDSTRDNFNRLKLVYSVYDRLAETWSEPKAVYDDGHMDASPNLAIDGSDIYVVWQKFTKTFNDENSLEVSDVLECAEIYTAKYDSANDEFVSATRITNDNSYDYAPSVTVKNGTANVFYATNPANTLVSSDNNKITKVVSGNKTVLKSGLATVNGIDSAVVGNDVQVAYSTDTDGDIETTNDINVFYGSSAFAEVPAISDIVSNAVMNFTYANIDGTNKLIYTDGYNIYYEKNGEATPVLEDSTTISGRISAVSDGTSTNVFWTAKTEAGNEIYTAAYENGSWSNAVALTDRRNEFSNVALTYVNNTLLGVANETLVTYDSESESYSKGNTNFVFLKVNDFCDLTASDIDILQYNKDEGDLTGINLNVTNNGNITLDKLYFDITDTNGYEKTYYIETELLPGKSESCWLPYEIPSNFSATSVSVKVYSENNEDIKEDDNTVSYDATKADILASALPVTYFRDGCIVSAEIVNYNFADAENVQTFVTFEENGEKISENYIGTINQTSKATVEFAYAFDELNFDENGVAIVYMTVTADNAESTTLTFIVEKNDYVCAHPVTEDLGQIEPTCTEEGYHAGTKCMGCGEYVSGGEVIPATGHTAVKDNAVQPTCTETGLTEGTHCSVCNAVLTEQEEVEALGHNFSTNKITTEPDCTHTGIRTYYCSRCDATRTETVSANGHSWDSGTITTQPTCTSTGVKHFNCTRCDATKDETVAKKEHTDENRDAICEICGNNVSDILPGETKTVTITGGSITYLKFVPTVSGNYTFSSNSSSDTYGYLYNANKSEITHDDDGGSGNNFQITYNLIQGQTYYFGCRYYNSSNSGSYSVTLTLNSVLETLYPNEGTTTVIDTMNGYIYGINPYITNPFDYFTVANGYTCESIHSRDNAFGTGSQFIVKSGDTTVAKYTLIIFGDVNGDGWYDGMDSMIVSCLANGMMTQDDVGEAVYMAADCNHDGVIDQLDVDILREAGVLLANIDQSKSTEELLENSSAYVECLNLIDQTVEVDDGATDEQIIDTPTDEPVNDKTNVFVWLVDVLVKILNYLKLHFAIIK